MDYNFALFDDSIQTQQEPQPKLKVIKGGVSKKAKTKDIGRIVKLVCATILFLFCVYNVLHSDSQILHINALKNEYEATLVETQSELDSLQMKYDSTVNAQIIGDNAMRLGLVKPCAAQIVYISTNNGNNMVTPSQATERKVTLAQVGGWVETGLSDWQNYASIQSREPVYIKLEEPPKINSN